MARSVSRRGFLGGAAAFAAAGCRSMFSGSASDYDESLSVLISDLHVGGTSYCQKYQEGRLRKVVAEILAMDPLPKRVLCFGDVAWTAGWRLDYQRSKPILQMLVDAGVDLKITMGNHDRRSHFLESWPEYAVSSPVPGKIVSVVPLADADFVLLDTLKGDDNRGERQMGPVEGVLDGAQLEWLEDWMRKARRPFFLGAHHFDDLCVEGKGILARMCEASPYATAWVHGHAHSWRSVARVASWRQPRMLQVLTLPSTGHWGDIGYVTFRTSPDGACAQLHQDDFFFSTPEGRPPFWRHRVAENDGAKAHFVFRSANIP